VETSTLLLIGAGLFLLSRNSLASQNYNPAYMQPGGLDWTDMILVNMSSGALVESTPSGYIDRTTGAAVDPAEVESFDAPDTSPGETGNPPMTQLDDSELPSVPPDGLTPVAYDVTNRNLYAFLQLIKHGESPRDQYDGYRSIVYGGYFDDFSQHPKIFKQIPGSTKKTSAAGAYQITWTTWNDLQQSLQLPDFSPESQDKAAIALIKRRGAMGDVIAGRFESAIVKCQNEWTSLPGAAEQGYGMNKAKQVLASYGATFSNSVIV